jgi:hypothetical protein
MTVNKKNIDDHFFEKKCNWSGCFISGDYPAPKLRDDRNDRYYFCLEHVRIYNKTWDFFAGMSKEEIEHFQADSLTGHRKTFRRVVNQRVYSESEIKEEIFREFDFKQYTEISQISADEVKYIKMLGLKKPFTMSDVKDNYKQLAKKYHPDVVCGGNDEKFKALNEAYQYFKNSGIK